MLRHVVPICVCEEGYVINLKLKKEHFYTDMGAVASEKWSGCVPIMHSRLTFHATGTSPRSFCRPSFVGLQAQRACPEAEKNPASA